MFGNRSYLNTALFAATCALATQANARSLQYSIDPSLHAQPSHVRLAITPAEVNSNDTLDVLFVIDSSGSMAAQQQHLSQVVPNLVSKLTEKADVQAAVTTSGDYEYTPGKKALGSFVGPVLKSNAPSFAKDLSSQVLVGTEGDATEKFFDPTMQALSAPLSQNTNAGFLRKDAVLSVVFVTDADDQSIATTDSFLEFMNQLKGLGNYSLTGFIVPSADQTCDRSGEDAPLKIEDALKRTNGRAVNLCGDWTEGIQVAAGSMKKALQKTIRLPYVPSLQTIRVTYGAIVIAAGDLHNGWVFDSASNSIVLGDSIDFKTLPAAELVVEFDQAAY